MFLPIKDPMIIIAIMLVIGIILMLLGIALDKVDQSNPMGEPFRYPSNYVLKLLGLIFVIIGAIAVMICMKVG